MAQYQHVLDLDICRDAADIVFEGLRLSESNKSSDSLREFEQSACGQTLLILS
jgi:hypothetical protein